MFEVTTAQAGSILTSLGTTGNSLITSLVALAAVFLGVAGLRWVLRVIRSAMHL